jgi:hypothetical protein
VVEEKEELEEKQEVWWSCRESVYTWLIKIRSASGQLSPIRHLHLQPQLSLLFSSTPKYP